MGRYRNEIELIEDVADWLKIWAAETPPANNVPGFIPHRNKLITINRKIDKVLMYLRFDRPDVANAVEEKWKHLIDLALADFPNSSDLKEPIIYAAIGSASLLADTLHDIAKTAKKERNEAKRPRVKKGIYSFIIVLAALLAILYYLGWLDPIKAFIYKILVPN